MKHLFLSLMITSSLLFSCKHRRVVFLEDNKLPSGATNFKYYSKVLTDTNFLFKLDASFKLSRIGAEERIKCNAYSKVFYSEGDKIRRVENYKRDEFNSHVFYPFLIFDVEEKQDSYVVTVTRKQWDKTNNKVRDVSISVRIVKKFKDIDFAKFLEKLESGEEIKKNIRFYFVAFDNKANREVQEAITSDLDYVVLEGYAKEFEDKKIKMFFFEENRIFGAMELKKPYLVRASYIKTQGEYICLRFLSIVTEENEREVGSKMEERIYNSED